MGAMEWFLLIVVVILIPLAIAVVVTLWTLEQARKRNRRNRPEGQGKQVGVARKATRPAASSGDGQVRDAMSEPGEARRRDDPTFTGQEERPPQSEVKGGRDEVT